MLLLILLLSGCCGRSSQLQGDLQMRSYRHALTLASSCRQSRTLSTWKQKKAHRKDYNTWVHVGKPTVSSNLTLESSSYNYAERDRTVAVIDQVKIEFELLRSIRGIFKGN